MNRRPPRNGEKQVKKTNTLLIDGNALFKFSFLGAKNEYNQNGEHIGGLYSFLVIMRKLLNEEGRGANVPGSGICDQVRRSVFLHKLRIGYELYGYMP